MYFSDKDRNILERLKYNPKLTPNFEFIKSCLIWEDERPDGLSEDGVDKLSNLWIARYYIYHSGLPESKWWNPELFITAWNQAQESKVKWPGFEKDRLRLSEVDKEYLRIELSKSNEF